MGQPISVRETRSSDRRRVRLETNRPLSGMGHERYLEPPSALLDRPVDELARRLFATGQAESIHINGSVVTVSLVGGASGEGLADVVAGLFIHYTGDDAGPGPDTAAGEPPEATPADGTDGAPAPEASSA